MTTYDVWVETLVCVRADNHEQAEQIALEAVSTARYWPAVPIEKQTVTASSERDA